MKTMTTTGPSISEEVIATLGEVLVEVEKIATPSSSSSSSSNYFTPNSTYSTSSSIQPQPNECPSPSSEQKKELHGFHVDECRALFDQLDSIPHPSYAHSSTARVVTRIAASKNYLAAGTSTGILHLFNLRIQQSVRPLRNPQQVEVTSLRFCPPPSAVAPTRDVLAIGHADGTVIVIGLPSGEERNAARRKMGQIVHERLHRGNEVVEVCWAVPNRADGEESAGYRLFSADSNGLILEVEVDFDAEEEAEEENPKYSFVASESSPVRHLCSMEDVVEMRSLLAYSTSNSEGNSTSARVLFKQQKTLDYRREGGGGDYAELYQADFQEKRIIGLNLFSNDASSSAFFLLLLHDNGDLCRVDLATKQRELWVNLSEHMPPHLAAEWPFSAADCRVVFSTVSTTTATASSTPPSFDVANGCEEENQQKQMMVGLACYAEDKLLLCDCSHVAGDGVGSSTPVIQMEFIHLPAASTAAQDCYTVEVGEKNMAGIVAAAQNHNTTMDNITEVVLLGGGGAGTELYVLTTQGSVLRLGRDPAPTALTTLSTEQHSNSLQQLLTQHLSSAAEKLSSRELLDRLKGATWPSAKGAGSGELPLNTYLRSLAAESFTSPATMLSNFVFGSGKSSSTSPKDPEVPSSSFPPISPPTPPPETAGPRETTLIYDFLTDQLATTPSLPKLGGELMRDSVQLRDRLYEQLKKSKMMASGFDALPVLRSNTKARATSSFFPLAEEDESQARLGEIGAMDMGAEEGISAGMDMTPTNSSSSPPSPKFWASKKDEKEMRKETETCGENLDQELFSAATDEELSFFAPTKQEVSVQRRELRVRRRKRMDSGDGNGSPMDQEPPYLLAKESTALRCCYEVPAAVAGEQKEGEGDKNDEGNEGDLPDDEQMLALKHKILNVIEESNDEPLPTIDEREESSSGCLATWEDGEQLSLHHSALPHLLEEKATPPAGANFTTSSAALLTIPPPVMIDEMGSEEEGQLVGFHPIQAMQAELSSPFFAHSEEKDQNQVDTAADEEGDGGSNREQRSPHQGDRGATLPSTSAQASGLPENDGNGGTTTDHVTTSSSSEQDFSATSKTLASSASHRQPSGRLPLNADYSRILRMLDDASEQCDKWRQIEAPGAVQTKQAENRKGAAPANPTESFFVSFAVSDNCMALLCCEDCGTQRVRGVKRWLGRRAADSACSHRNPKVYAATTDGASLPTVGGSYSVEWRELTLTADAIAMNDSGSILWRIHDGVAYAPTIHSPADVTFEENTDTLNSSGNNTSPLSLAAQILLAESERHSPPSDCGNSGPAVEWMEQTSSQGEGRLLSVAMSSRHAWYLTDAGHVCVQMELPTMGILFRDTESPFKLSQVAASDHAVWALKAGDGRLVVRVGLKHCPMGTDWVEEERPISAGDPNNHTINSNDPYSPRYPLVSIALHHHTGYALDSDGVLWLRTHVSESNPFGVGGYWLGVHSFTAFIESLAAGLGPTTTSPTPSSTSQRHPPGEWRVKASRRGVFVNTGSSVVTANYPLSAHRFARVLPRHLSATESFTLLSAGGFGGAITASIHLGQQRPNAIGDEFFALSVQRCNLTSLPPLPKGAGQVLAIHSAAGRLYSLDNHGNIYFTNTTTAPAGGYWGRSPTTSSGWLKLKPCEDGCRWLSLAVSASVLWAVSSDWRVWVCLGIADPTMGLTTSRRMMSSSDESSANAPDVEMEWIEVEGPKCEGKEALLDQIRISPSGSQLWLFSTTTGRCWTRLGLNQVDRIGRLWAEAPSNVLLGELAVGEHSVWALAKEPSRRVLHRLRGYSPRSPTGLYWRPMPGVEQQLRTISIDAVDDRLWALDVGGKLLRHEMGVIMAPEDKTDPNASVAKEENPELASADGGNERILLDEHDEVEHTLARSDEAERTSMEASTIWCLVEEMEVEG